MSSDLHHRSERAAALGLCLAGLACGGEFEPIELRLQWTTPIDQQALLASGMADAGASQFTRGVLLWSRFEAGGDNFELQIDLQGPIASLPSYHEGERLRVELRRVGQSVTALAAQTAWAEVTGRGDVVEAGDGHFELTFADPRVRGLSGSWQPAGALSPFAPGDPRRSDPGPAPTDTNPPPSDSNPPPTGSGSGGSFTLPDTGCACDPGAPDPDPEPEPQPEPEPEPTPTPAPSDDDVSAPGAACNCEPDGGDEDDGGTFDPLGGGDDTGGSDSGSSDSGSDSSSSDSTGSGGCDCEGDDGSTGSDSTGGDSTSSLRRGAAPRLTCGPLPPAPRSSRRDHAGAPRRCRADVAQIGGQLLPLFGAWVLTRRRRRPR